MRFSQFALTTLKEVPAEAEIVSHQLMLRAGLIRRLASGLFTWMPLGLRVLRKVEKVVREEMDRAGALELLMPAVQPAELWQESGRWDQYGPLLLRTRLVRLARPIERVGAGVLMFSPFIGALTRAPQLGLVMFAAGFVTLATSALVHFVTLPTEFDASFARALPLLDRHKILKSVDRPHARRLLTAAALTYVAASLMSILNIARWWAILRR